MLPYLVEGFRGKAAEITCVASLLLGPGQWSLTRFHLLLCALLCLLLNSSYTVCLKPCMGDHLIGICVSFFHQLEFKRSLPLKSSMYLPCFTQLGEQRSDVSLVNVTSIRWWAQKIAGALIFLLKRHWAKKTSLSYPLRISLINICKMYMSGLREKQLLVYWIPYKNGLECCVKWHSSLPLRQR